MAYPTIALTGQWNPGSSVALHRANMPSGILAGDLLLVFAWSHTSGGITPDGKWTRLLVPFSSSGNAWGNVFHCIADGSETGDIALATYGSGKFGGTITHVIRSYSGDPEEAAAAVSSASATSIDPPALTPSGGSAEYLWFAPSGFFAAGRTATPPAGYSGQVSGPASGMSTLSYAVSWRLATAASEDPGSVAWSGAAGALAAQTVSVQGLAAAAVGSSQAVVIG